jgi:hypothetical protein
MVYANFNLKKVEQEEPKEISISLIMVDGSEAFDKPKPVESPKEQEPEQPAPKEEVAQAKEKEPEKVIAPKKTAKPKESKIAKSVAKTPAQEKAPEFKEEETPKEKEQVAEEEKPEEEDASKKDPDKAETPEPEKETETKEIATDDKKTTDQKSEKYAGISNLENINLSAREKFNIQTQLRRCYKRAIGDNTDNKLKIVIVAKINKDGFINSNLDEIIDMQKYNDLQNGDYKIAVDNVKKALSFCSPLRNLPLDKYEIWKEVLLEFGGE